MRGRRAYHPEPRRGQRSLGAVPRVRRYGITHSQFVPRQLDQFLAAVRDFGEAEALPRLRWAFNGGEALPTNLAVEWDRLFVGARISNTYGMTESSIYATNQVMHRGLAQSTARCVVGGPIVNTRVFCGGWWVGVVSRLGVVGELLIWWVGGGSGLFGSGWVDGGAVCA